MGETGSRTGRGRAARRDVGVEGDGEGAGDAGEEDMVVFGLVKKSRESISSFRYMYRAVRYNQQERDSRLLLRFVLRVICRTLH